jgi:hypothetical protein
MKIQATNDRVGERQLGWREPFAEGAGPFGGPEFE